MKRLRFIIVVLNFCCKARASRMQWSLLQLLRRRRVSRPVVNWAQNYDVFVELLLSIQMKKCSFCSFFTQIEHYIKYFYYLCGE